MDDASSALSSMVYRLSSAQTGGIFLPRCTTNFDRLLEQALEAVGITPTVISTADAVAGALPLHLTPCTIIKLHGDYLDVRIKNTPDELATYDDQVNTPLDRVFDEHGLIICGWSGDWDTALRAAIERCPSRRFAIFWMAKSGMVSSRAQQLITLRSAQIVAVESADTAFQSLAEKIAALDTFSRPHSLSTAMAVATLKNYLVEDRHRIRLHDLVMEEIGRLRAELYNPQFTASLQTTTDDALAQELQRRVMRDGFVFSATRLSCFSMRVGSPRLRLSMMSV